MNHKSRRPLTTSESANELLGKTLAALDTVIQDAQQPDAGNSLQAGRKRQRGGDFFAAMAEPHLYTLRSLVVTYGVQLAPSLDAIARRVLLAVASPGIASAASWELAALLGTYFRAGAVRVLEELMELLLNERPPFLLAAPCVVGWTGAATEAPSVGEGDGDVSTPVAEDEKEEENTSKVLRSLRALEELLFAVGPYMNASMMQRATLRFAQEVVMEGILDAPPSSLPADNRKHLGGKKGNSNNNNSNDSGLQQQQRTVASSTVFLVEEALQPLFVDLLTSFLLLCRPLPGVVSACVVRVLKELPARPITMRNCRENQNLLRSISRLSATFTALRHPHALPFYLPPIDIVEKPTRRVAGDISSAGGDRTTDVPASLLPSRPSPPPTPSVGVAPQPGETQQQQQQQQQVAATDCARPVSSSPPHQTISAARQQQSFLGRRENRGRDVLPAAAVPQQQQKQQRNTPVKPSPPVGPTAEESDEEDEMPEIDMED
ncbi:hypothetical protein, conserved [Trypanosoma cruzi]|uniref:Uncharacterized protein n=1 Tax=Trypanosoma cruzi (strain CL Brener) TaxID=353153 RepID=Q4DYI1_TRYCC|nr:hypothetical protein, conserved [Trypanosoma cruzi]EAN97569.1 hypothetical protein, conserved [Trypanosoma cruzi]|eukprot:XP_819420.1 hypothetical protein [Trypanosoma cruzi strain CL Brener]